MRRPTVRLARPVVWTALSLLLLPQTHLRAQQRGLPRLSVGISLQGSDPRGDFARNTGAGDFARNTGNGLGAGAYALVRLDPAGLLNLRADVSVLSYANSNRRIPLANSGGLVQLDLNTSSNIASVVVGPQLLGPSGAFTPYATALGGFSVFWTSTSVEGSNNNARPFATTTNASHVGLAYGGAVGAYARVANGRLPVRLDLGARFLRHDDTRYLTDQRVQEAFTANATPRPVRGRADFVTYYLGANLVVW